MQEWLQNNLLMVISINFIITLVLLFLYILNNILLRKYRSFFKSEKNIDTIVLEITEDLKKLQDKVEAIAQRQQENKLQLEKNLGQWNLIRFKAFEVTGGDQSFAFALLNEQGDGVVLTSIYGRDESRIYCKPLQKGESIYQLSDEEKEAIAAVLAAKNKKKE